MGGSMLADDFQRDGRVALKGVIGAPMCEFLATEFRMHKEVAYASQGKDPADPKAFEEQQRKLQEELQKKADEARKKLEGQQSQAPGAPTAPAPGQKK